MDASPQQDQVQQQTPLVVSPQEGQGQTISSMPPGTPPPPAGLTPQAHKSHLPLIVVGLFIAVVVMGLAVYLFVSTGTQPQAMKTEVVGKKVVAPTISPKPTVDPASATDEKVDTDMKAIDDNMNTVGTDTTSIDQGLNDQQADLNQ